MHCAEIDLQVVSMQNTLTFRPVSLDLGSAQALFCRHLEQCHERKPCMQNCQTVKKAESPQQRGLKQS